MFLRLAEESWTFSDDDLRLIVCMLICAAGIGAIAHFAGRR